MGTFGSQKFAEALRRWVRSEIDRKLGALPRPLVGRAYSVDAPAGTASVILAGDTSPIEVRLRDKIPARWQAQDLTPSVSPTASTGYGDICIVEKLGGQYYITHVLSGPNQDYFPSSWGRVLTVMQSNRLDGAYDFSVSSGGYYATGGGDHYVELSIGLTDQSLQVGEAMLIGPFLETQPRTTGTIEVEYSDPDSVRTWRAVVSEADFAKAYSAPNVAWKRLIPDRSYHGNNLIGANTLWDLDIAPRETDAGYDPVTQTRCAEYWLRLTKVTDAASSGADGILKVNGTLFSRARALASDQAVYAIRDTTPTEHYGFLGVANSGFIPDRSFTDYISHFQTVSASNFDHVTEVAPFTWTTSGGSASNYSIAAPGVGSILIASSTRRFARVTSDELASIDLQSSEFTCQVTFSPSALSVGGNPHYIGFSFGTLDTDHYEAVAVLNSDGTMLISIYEQLSSVRTLRASTALFMAYGPNDKFVIRAQLVMTENPTLRASVWTYASNAEPTWQASWAIPSGTFIATTTAVGLTVQNSGAGGGYQPTINFEDFRLYVRPPTNLNGEISTDGSGVRTRPAEYEALQRWTCTGVFTWDYATDSLLWTGDILFTGAGVSRYLLTEGRASLACPGSASKEIPLLPGPYSSFASATGIQINRGQSLWVLIPPGTPCKDLAGNLFLLDCVPDGVNDSRIPPYAVLIAANPQSASDLHLVNLGNGAVAGPRSIANTLASSSATTSAAYTTAVTAGSSTVVELVFVAPASGTVLILWSATMALAGAATAYVAPKVRTSSTPGSGTVVLDALDSHGMMENLTNTNARSASYLLTGLTPGALYNVQLLHKTSASTLTMTNRRLSVVPA